VSEAIDSLLQTPLRQDLETIEQRSAGTPLTPENEATIRAFFTGFWVGADEYLRSFRDDLDQLDPPAAVRNEHDEFIAAVDALIETTDDRLAEITTRDPAELLASLWEPDDESEAMNAACEALAAAASRIGFDAPTCP